MDKRKIRKVFEKQGFFPEMLEKAEQPKFYAAVCSLLATAGPAASQPEQCMGLTEAVQFLSKVVTDAADMLRECGHSDTADQLDIATAKVLANADAILARQTAPTQPALTVWYGPMPESNGKSNFTAVLMRKDAMWGGPHVTIERSEYPDRIRYEADRVRHLIGELAEEPFILDYDPDKHSGYKAPQVMLAAAPSPAPAAQEGKAQDDGYSTSDQLIPTSRIARLAKQAAQPMCETCDDPAMVLADGTLGPCGACQDFAAMPAAQQTSAQVGPSPCACWPGRTCTRSANCAAALARKDAQP